ncbi:zinc finger, CCHC-type containing protein [Tanacetum coccineum]
MHFLRSSMSVVHVLTTPIPEDGGDDGTVEQIRKGPKLWDSLETKYMAEDALSKKFLSSSSFGSSLIWADSDKPKGNNVAGPSFVNMVEHNNSFAYNDNKGKRKHHDNTRADPNKKAKPTCWKCGKTGHIKRDCKGVNVGNKANGSSTKGSVNGSSNSLKCQNMFNKSLQVYYVTYVSEANFVHDDVNSPGAWTFCFVYLLHTKDEALDKFKVFKTEVELQQRPLIKRFRTDREVKQALNAFLLDMLSIPRLLVVPEEVTEEDVQQPEPELRKSKRNRTPKNFGPEFQLYLIEGTKDEVSDQHSYCFNVEDDPKTFDEAMKSQDVAFWKEAINDEMDSIMGNNTWVLADLPPAFLNGDLDEKSYYIEKVLKKFNYFDCTPLSTLMDTSEKLMPNNGQAVSQLEYSRVIGYLMYAMNYTRPDISFAVGKLISLAYTGYPSVLEGYTDASWISNTKDNSSTSGWVFLLGGGEISWATKKQTYITGSTMESEFVALAAAVKEAEWLRNLILEIPLWSKPIAPISIRCYSAATLAKAYSQMYNGKSRHLGVRHSMIRGLITNGLISIEFVRSQQNLATHLMKGLAGDLVIKSAEGMGLKSN